MSPRFVADADFNQRILRGVRRREPSLDIWSAGEAGLLGESDARVLKIAAQASRVLVSHDRKTMPSYFAAFVSKNPSPELVIVDQNFEIGLAIEELVLVWAACQAEEFANRIRFLPLH